jgi:hypothetical protein
MIQIVLFAVLAVLLGGCGMTSSMKMENGLLIQEVGQTNLFRPSMSVMRISECVPEDGVTTVIDIDGNSKTCYGRFVEVVKVQGTQAGSLTGLGGDAIQGGFMLGTGIVVADGIRDSGSKTTNNNNTTGGSSSNTNANLNQPYSISNSGSTSKASGGSVINKGHRR